MHQIQLNNIFIGGGTPFVLIAGPCVIEDEAKTVEIAVFLKELTDHLQIPFIFKASFDKANRTSIHSYRGPGLREGLRILSQIKRNLAVSVLTDVHRYEEIKPVSKIVDILQVPAFLCRQTDFVVEIARQARVINIKKGQFLAPRDVKNIILKATSTGNENVMMTERGTSFGYNNLVVDFRSLPEMRAMGYPVIFDATHSVQLPGGATERRTGQAFPQWPAPGAGQGAVDQRAGGAGPGARVPGRQAAGHGHPRRVQHPPAGTINRLCRGIKR